MGLPQVASTVVLVYVLGPTGSQENIQREFRTRKREQRRNTRPKKKNRETTSNNERVKAAGVNVAHNRWEDSPAKKHEHPHASYRLQPGEALVTTMMARARFQPLCWQTSALHPRTLGSMAGVGRGCNLRASRWRPTPIPAILSPHKDPSAPSAGFLC